MKFGEIQSIGFEVEMEEHADTHKHTQCDLHHCFFYFYFDGRTVSYKRVATTSIRRHIPFVENETPIPNRRFGDVNDPVQHSSRGFIQKTLSLASFATAK
jgi:hypothetical protein